jgi:hypothetical protein
VIAAAHLLVVEPRPVAHLLDELVGSIWRLRICAWVELQAKRRGTLEVF